MRQNRRLLAIDATAPLQAFDRTGKSAEQILKDFPVDTHGLSYSYRLSDAKRTNRSAINLTIRQGMSPAAVIAVLRKLAVFIEQHGTELLTTNANYGGELQHENGGLIPVHVAYRRRQAQELNELDELDVAPAAVKRPAPAPAPAAPAPAAPAPAPAPSWPVEVSPGVVLLASY